MIIGAFGVERKVIVEFLFPLNPLNVTELFTAFVCHAFPENTATMPVNKGSGMLGWE